MLLLLPSNPFSLSLLLCLHDTGPFHRFLALRLFCFDSFLLLPVSFGLGRCFRRLAFPLKSFGFQPLVLGLDSSQFLQSFTFYTLFLCLFDGGKA